MEVNIAAVTVRLAVPEIVPDMAVIVEVPTATPCASPVVLTIATGLADDFHVADALRSCMLPSLRVPVAVNCCERPAAIVAVAGETAIETRTGAVTVSTADPVFDPLAAVMEEVPAAFAVARPARAMVATVGLEEFQIAVLVRSCELPSLYFPMAENCWVVPAGIEGFAGVIWMLRSVRPLCLELPPHAISGTTRTSTTTGRSHVIRVPPPNAGQPNWVSFSWLQGKGLGQTDRDENTNQPGVSWLRDQHRTR
jgi:hypothetical protein